MSKLKRLATVSDTIVEIDSPFSLDEINQRNKDYSVISDKKFATKYSKSLFHPATFRINGKEHSLNILPFSIKGEKAKQERKGGSAKSAEKEQI